MNPRLLVLRCLIGTTDEWTPIVEGLPQRDGTDNRSVAILSSWDFLPLIKVRDVRPVPTFLSILRGGFTCREAYWQYHFSQAGTRWRRITFLYERGGQPCGLAPHRVQERLGHLTAGVVYVNLDRSGREHELNYSVAMVGFTPAKARKELLLTDNRDHPFVVLPVLPSTAETGWVARH